MLIYQDKEKYLLEQNNTKLLGGLWAFEQRKTFNLTKKVTSLGAFTHHYTHFRLDAKVLLINEKKQDKKYFYLEEIDKLALSGADRKALEMLRRFCKE